jgi:tetratricopeptide (TPR) repeat protein
LEKTNRGKRERAVSPWTSLCRSLALGATGLFVLCLVLTQVEILEFLGAVVKWLFFAAGLLWLAFYLLRYRESGEQKRHLFSGQGPGGEMVQLASLNGFRRRMEVEDGDAAEESFAEAERRFRSSRFSAAAEACQRSIDAAPTLPGYLNLGAALLNIADFEQAQEVLELGLGRARREGDVEFEAAFLADLGQLHARRGRMQEALQSYEEGMGLFRRLGDLRGRADCLLNIGSVYAHQGRQEARQTCELALKLHQQVGSRLGRANGLSNLGFILTEAGDIEAAMQRQRAALKLHENLKNPLGQGQVLTRIGNVHFRKEELEEARAAYERASELHRQVGDPLGEASGLVNAGNVLFREGEPEEALEAYERALEVHTRVGNVLGQANTLTNIGSVLARQRKLAEALEVLTQARDLYQSTGVKNRGREVAETVIARLERRRERAQQRTKKQGE